MKTRRLSEIDLARFCALPTGSELDMALRRYNMGGGAWSYNPARASMADAAGAQPPLDGLRVARPSWEKIKGQVKRACTHGIDQEVANVGVAKALFDLASKEEWKARVVDLSAMPIGLAEEKVRYWCDVVMDDGSGPFVSFHDHRRNGGVTNGEIERVVFSMQHSWLEARFPDLVGVRLAIFRYAPGSTERHIRVRFADGVELLSYDELNSRVRDVYAAWGRISRERTEERRKKA